MATIEEISEEMADEFALFDEWVDKYAYIIDLGKSIPVIDEKFKDDDHKIRGCQSQVWLQADLRDGKVYFTADSDAIITRGLAALLVRVLSGQAPQDIMDAKLDFLDRIGLKDHLSPTRANGLASMVKQMKLYAAAYRNKQC